MASAELSSVALYLFEHPLGCVSCVRHSYLVLIKFYQFAQFMCRQIRTLVRKMKYSFVAFKLYIILVIYILKIKHVKFLPYYHVPVMKETAIQDNTY